MKSFAVEIKNGSSRLLPERHEYAKLHSFSTPDFLRNLMSMCNLFKPA